ncbi:MAG: hypothetical protein HF982_06135 [Desulfobacteraceae bacterium]|nr:hypothetical protein [Desulfobacteraceae bacterium]MBC2719153.1 hypothetical protein [Desulfobacteraceae bacterium]
MGCFQSDNLLLKLSFSSGGPPKSIGGPDLGWHVGRIYPSLYEKLSQFSSVDPNIP